MKRNVIASTVAEGTMTEKQEGDITIQSAEGTEKVYTFRTLNSTDTFLMFKIIGKIGINEFSACFEKDTIKNMIASASEGQTDKLASVVGLSVILEIANVIIGNLPKCEQEIYQMLSNVSGLSVDEIKELGFATFAEMVIDFVKKPEFKDFIKVVSKLFK